MKPLDLRELRRVLTGEPPPKPAKEEPALRAATRLRVGQAADRRVRERRP
jgi:hypothetical protein